MAGIYETPISRRQLAHELNEHFGIGDATIETVDALLDLDACSNRIKFV